MSQYVEVPGIEVWTEGKTDWMHLKTAMRKLGIQLPIGFHEDDQSTGDDKLLKACKTFAQHDNSSPLVFIFDRDKEDIVREVSDPNNLYKLWGNNVYSFAIPQPSHRPGYTNVSIELFYKDEELQTMDANGRRLFLTSEFTEKTGKLASNKQVSIGNKNLLKNCAAPTSAKVVDSDVYDADSNIALSKAQFAKYVTEDIAPFDCFDFTEFRPIFHILAEIVRATRHDRSVYLPDFEHLFESLEGELPSYQLSTLFDRLRRLIALGMQVFIISTVRFYEDAIVNESAEGRKKVKTIKTLLRERFFSPSFHTLHELTEKCFHLVDATAPASLQAMKQCLDEVFILEAIGQMLDDLERLFPPKQGKPIRTNKAAIRRTLISYVFEEFARFDTKLLTELEERVQNFLESEVIQIETWKQALLQMAKLLQPLLSRPLELRSLRRVDPRTGVYTVEIQTYYDNNYSINEVQISSDEAAEYQTNFSRLLFDDQLAVHVYPMLLVKENALYFYQRSRASGYEYYSLVNDRIHIEPTKKKFNHAVFKVGSTQEFFWTDVIPIVNPENGVRANIPQEGLEDFVGREVMKQTIREEILEIPNMDGIVFGPGGIGKTALMQQLTQELYLSSNNEEKLFDSIIWVSAKGDYYDHIFGTIELRQQYSKSFDDVLTAILQFFEFEDVEEYDFDDKKYLVLEVLSDNRTLLILDNFETIPEADALKIVQFFRTEVKKRLRHQPDYFKVIITSRKQIPSGFHQIQLKGLDLREARLLIQRLQEHYRVQRMLTADQEREIHDATLGIPIVIKHCFGQLYEYNQPLQTVLRELTRFKSEIVQFSYKEILRQVESSDRSGIQLRVLLLLELLNYPLMIRQIAEILGVEEPEVEEKLPLLMSFQCLQVVYPNGQEKYVLNNEIRMLTKSLARQHADLVKDLLNKVANSSVEQEFDASAEELHIASIFENYLTERSLLEAEDFMSKQLTTRRNSVLLNYHYARYLVERKQQNESSIEILERIREASNNHPKVLGLLVKCYMSLDIPKYESAELYASELETKASKDAELSMLLAEFYTDWSSQLKSRRELDALDEKSRQKRYKDLADKALALLNLLPGQLRTDRHYYLFAQCYYNKWCYEEALRMIDKAIEKADTPRVYEWFRRKIIATQGYYSGARTGCQ
ncbi:MAG: NB-ARC domain-containing protein [Chloroflexota bacterium]